jgi:lysophospholipase L1-like esterase
MEEKTSNERREFLKKALVFSAATAFDPQLISAAAQKKKNSKGGDGFTFLFQGDSITDGNRTRNNDWNHVMGHGYQYIIASKLWYDFPKKGFHFFNRGISGNKVSDLTERWQKDALELNPNVLSILVGINDSAAFIDGKKDFSVEQYEKDYRSLLQQTRQQLPNIEFVLCEPFILPVGKVKDKWEDYSKEVKKRQEVVQRLGKEHNAIFVPFQSAFDKALSTAPADYWIWDGIHPMPAGHELMAREWIYRVSKKLKFIKW